MSETAKTPLIENDLFINEHVKELLTIIKENGTDASALTALIGYVDAVGNQLKAASDELSSMRHELDIMKQERRHPMRIALQNAVTSLEARIDDTKAQLDDIKDKIVEGCKNAVAAVKEKGISVLNGIVDFFRIKPAFESLRTKLQNDIKHDQAVIAKIETVSAEYHSAGRHIKNIGRVLRGKEPITAVKPNGKLAKLASAPFRTELKCLNNALRDIDKAITALERLGERAAAQKEASSERGGKPSVPETMKRLEAKIADEKKTAPAVDKAIHAGAEL